MIVYLTKFPINLSRRQAKTMLANPYRLHAAVAASFPSSDGNDEGRVLWRVDYPSDGGALLYISSPGKPSMVGLDEQIGWPDLDQQWQTRDYEPLLSRIENDQTWSFRLVANPVVNRSGIRAKDGQGRSKRLNHLTELQQAAWLIGEDAYIGTGKPVPELFMGQQTTRAERNGFRVVPDSATGIPQMVVSNSRKLTFGPGKSKSITLAVARYDGLLQVTDADLLRHALVNGIGHGKGFGCGLLTLAPARQR